MKLDILSREITDITVTDDEVTIALEVQVSHGKVKKSVTPITVEHTVSIQGEIPEKNLASIDDAILLAVAGVKQRADGAIAALRGLTEL